MSKYKHSSGNLGVAGRLLFAGCAAGAFFQGEASLMAQVTVGVPARVEVVRRIPEVTQLLQGTLFS